MKYKNLLINGLVGTFIASISLVSGFYISKKRYFPKKVSGTVYIDYQEDNQHPAMYIANLEEDVITGNADSAIFYINRIRK